MKANSEDVVMKSTTPHIPYHKMLLDEEVPGHRDRGLWSVSQGSTINIGKENRITKKLRQETKEEEEQIQKKLTF